MTSLTQRSSGLVQRRTEASRSAAADKERGAGGGSEDEGRREEPGDDEKGDSKETRLTLMEEVLLLGLKDREVRTKGGAGGTGGRDGDYRERVWGYGGGGRNLPCVGWTEVEVVRRRGGRGWGGAPPGSGDDPALWEAAQGWGAWRWDRSWLEAWVGLWWLCSCSLPAAGTWEACLCAASYPQGFRTLSSPL